MNSAVNCARWGKRRLSIRKWIIDMLPIKMDLRILPFGVSTLLRRRHAQDIYTVGHMTRWGGCRVILHMLN